MIVVETSRVNLGSGKYPMPGFTNVDLICEADVQGDLRSLDFRDLEQVRMSHLLEHISWRETVPVLERVRSWMRPGGLIWVEVPDMRRIMARGAVHPLWFKYVYGDQSHEGEYHLAGFTKQMLHDALTAAGWSVSSVTSFTSDHPGREGMPCLDARALA